MGSIVMFKAKITGYSGHLKGHLKATGLKSVISEIASQISLNQIE